MKNFVILLTGISGSGKTTISRAVARTLQEENIRVEIIDGDETRELIGNALGHSRQARGQMGYINRAIGYYLQKNAINVIYALVCPYEEIRQQFREFFGDAYIEVYVRSSAEICRERDVKGLYKLSDMGKLGNLNGTNDIFEEPQKSDLVLDTSHLTLEEERDMIIEYLRKNNFIE